MNSTQQQYAWFAPEMDNGAAPVRLRRGDHVTSFRGETFTFEGVDRPAYGNSTGRVAVSRECADAYSDGYGGRDCPHFWHRDGIERSEYFPNVFSLYLGDEKGVKA